MPPPEPTRGTLVGRRVALRPLLPEDHEWLYSTALSTSAGSRWRLHGALPPPEQFFAMLNDSTEANLVIGRPDHHDRIGFVQIWNVDARSRTGQLTAFLTDEHTNLGWPMEGLILAAGYAFEALDLRKLYLETLDSEVGQLESLIGWALDREGLLKEHQYVMGALEDCHVLALYRHRYHDALETLASRAL